VFSLVLVRVARTDTRELERRARMPLDAPDTAATHADGRTR